MRLAALGLTLSGGSLVNVAGGSSDVVSNAANLIVAITGLIAAISALVLGWQQRRSKDPRDKLIDVLLKEREELTHDEDTGDPPERPRRRRRPS